MRILLANPNTTQAVTDTIAATARAAAGPGTEILPVTAAFGARVIGTRSEMAIAEHAALDTIARHAEGVDAAIIGASVDSGLRAAREMFAFPVLAITEAALHVACLAGARFGTITLSRRSLHQLRELIAGYGLAGRCAAMRLLEVTPLDLLADPDKVAGLIGAEAERLVAEDMADVVVLVGAVMAPMAAKVQPRLKVPVVEGVSAAVVLAEAMARLKLPRPTDGSFAALPARETVGLSPALAARFSG